MQNTQIVFLTSDTDCDGTTYGAYRLAIPAHITGDDERIRYAVGLRGVDSEVYRALPRDEEIIRVMTLRDFFAEYGDEIGDRDDRDQFAGAWNPLGGRWIDGHGYEGGPGFNYSSLRGLARWNPWVFDDTIGIPALDTRYEEAYA